MASKIEQLRVSFDKMSTVQKKHFIDKLKIQLQNSKNAEYINFLNDCVRNYNATVRSGSSGSIPTPATRSNPPVNTPQRMEYSVDDVPVATNGRQKKSAFKWIAICLIIVFVIGGGVLASSIFSGGSVKNQIVGKWANTESGIVGVLYIFSSDGTYAYSLVGNKDLFSKTAKPGVISEEIGTYKISGKTITLQPKTDKSRTVDFLSLEDDGDTLFLGTDMEQGNYTRLKRQR